MSISSKLSHVFPHHEDVVVLKERPTDRRARSFWIGLTQAMLNFPRQVVSGIVVTAVVILVSTFAVFMTVLKHILVHPFMSLFSSVVLGSAGFLTDEGDDACTGQAIGKMVMMEGSSATVSINKGDDS